MHEGLLDGDDENEVGILAVHREPALQGAVAHNFALSTDTQRIAIARDQEQQPYVWMRKQILERVEPMVPRTVRDGQRLIVQNHHERRRIALGREVETSVSASGSNQEERARRDESAADVIDVIDDLLLALWLGCALSSRKRCRVVMTSSKSICTRALLMIELNPA